MIPTTRKDYKIFTLDTVNDWTGPWKILRSVWLWKVLPRPSQCRKEFGFNPNATSVILITKSKLLFLVSWSTPSNLRQKGNALGGVRLSEIPRSWWRDYEQIWGFSYCFKTVHSKNWEWEVGGYTLTQWLLNHLPKETLAALQASQSWDCFRQQSDSPRYSVCIFNVKYIQNQPYKLQINSLCFDSMHTLRWHWKTM